MSTQVEHLDLRVPLPRGLSAVEASAGTGKTYALTALAVHGVVLDDVRTEQLLVVTFTRAAAAELRGRVRAGLRDAAVALRTLATTGEVPVGLDDWLDALCRDGGAQDAPPPAPEEAQRRAAAAARALSTLDRASITTLHGFCQTALAQLGLRGTGTATRFTTDVTRLRSDVVRDRLLTLLASDPDALKRTTGSGDAVGLETPLQVEARIDRLVTDVLASGARVAPLGRSTDPVVDATARFVDEVVEELRGRLETEGELTFDELVRRMDRTLGDDRTGPVAVRQLRSRLRLVLVDEMQDTDAVQWRILRRAFLADPDELGPPSDVVIVGDPKQSIYRFRGADIDAYLEASADAGEQQRSLGSNWRSSAPLLGALDVLLRGARFGGPRIAYQPVRPGRPVDLRVRGTGAPLELRWIPRHEDLARSNDGRMIIAAAGDAHVLDDLALRVVDLLRDGRVVVNGDAPDDAAPGGTQDGTRALTPRDIAVLVRRNKEAVAVVERLAAAGVAAVQPKGGRVYGTDAFLQWRILLAALAQPSDLDLVRALLLSWFVDAPADVVDDEARTDALQQRCGEWRELLASSGAMALLAALRSDGDVAAALARAGERGTTDLEHLAELTHVALGARGAPASVVLRTLEELSLASARGEDDTDDPAVRRIGSDGDAVQVMTFHGAKGLEFPVVLLPFSNRAQNLQQPWVFRSAAGRVVDAGSTLGWGPEASPPAALGGARADTGGSDSGAADTGGAGAVHPDEPHARRATREALARVEQSGDEARLLYVALTRARDRCIVWWWPASGSDRSMLATLLFGDRGPDGALVAGASAPKLGDLDDAVTSTRLADLVERGQGGIEALVVPAQLGVAVQGRAPVVERAPLETARLDRDVHEPDVWRWSFTGLLRPLPGRAAGAGPAAAGRSDVGADDAGPDVAGDDEPDVVPTLEDDLDTGVGAGGDGDDAVRGEAVRGEAAACGPLVDLPGGTGFGVLVHEALEAVDLSLEPADVTVALRDELAARAARSGVPVDVERVAEGLALALDTPLEPILPGLRLRDVAAVDRIPELVFELPVADTHARVTLSALADAVSGALAADDPYRDAFATLPERLDRARFAGWLTGVVDLALRTEDGRYVVADYKSNRLTGLDGLPAYDASAMHAAMLHGEYPLQALLYLVGLHRILGRRLAGYDPAVHLGGAAFLFVRGMVGTGTPLRDGVRDGVCVWRPQVAAVLAADAVLRGGAR